jgi:Cd2+/Zn2+-exporting ATPase
MLTGDSEKAHYVANTVGCQKKYMRSLLPENKSDKMATLLKEYGRVAMVGDG